MALAWCGCCEPAATVVEDEVVAKHFFISGQWTSKFVDMHQGLLKQLSGSTVKASMPPFNNPLQMDFPSTIMAVNVPVFGVKITGATLRIFDNPDISNLLKEFEIQIPKDRINTFVQKKLYKVHEMLEAGRGEPSIAETQKEAMDRVEKFCREFESLTSDAIDKPAWERFLDKHVASNWADNLHLDDILKNFGFDQDAADRLGKMEYVYPDGERMPYQDYSLRWLSKVFLSYGPQVMVTDIVNLIFAMMQSESVVYQEALIAEVIERFDEKLKAGDVADLWVPTHFIMDAESDDFLAWAIIEWVHRLRGTELEVLVQLAMDPELDALAGRLASKMQCSLIRDKGSRNAQAIKDFIVAASLSRSTSRKRTEESIARGPSRQISLVAHAPSTRPSTRSQAAP